MTSRDHTLRLYIGIAAVAAFVALCVPGVVDAAFPLVGTSNTLSATGVTKDRHMVMFDQFMVEVHLDEYDTATHGPGKGKLVFRRSTDGFAWTEALVNADAVTIVSGKFFFLSGDMSGDGSCSTAQECNLYLVYSRNNAVDSASCIDGDGSSGDVYFRELTYDTTTNQWTAQSEVTVTSADWWDTYESWRSKDYPSCLNAREPEYDAEPKPQIWVEGNSAMVVYDMQTSHFSFSSAPACPQDTPNCWDGADYTYIRSRTMSRSTGGVWSVNSSARDIGVIKNCLESHANIWDPFDNSRPNAFTYAAITKNPTTNKLGVVVNRTDPGSGGCMQSDSTYDVGPFLDNAFDQVRLQYIENDTAGFTWSCGRPAGNTSTPLAACFTPPGAMIDNAHAPGGNFSVTSNTSTSSNNYQAIRVVYPSGTDIRMAEWRKTTAGGTYNWRPATNITTATGMTGQDVILPTIMSERDGYWIVAHAHPSGGAADNYRILHRRMSMDTSNPDPLNWSHVAVGGLGTIEEGGITLRDHFPTIPYANIQNYVTSLGHPPLIWTHGNAGPVNLYFPELKDYVRVNGWAWSPNFGWASLDYRNTGNLSTALKYGVYIGREGTAKDFITGTMWSPNIGWITFDRTLTGTPPTADIDPINQDYVAKFTPENNALEGWARILSLKDEGQKYDGTYDINNVDGDGTVERDCYPSQVGTQACDWGWVRLNGPWSNTTTTNLNMPGSLNPGATLATVISTVGFPVAGTLTVNAENDIVYSAKTATTFSVSGVTFTHADTSVVRLTTQSGTFSAGAQYMEDQQTFQFFDFAYSPAMGWMQFLPFRFVGFPYVRADAGNIYSGDQITIPAPTPANEYTSTYLIHANGTISDFITYAGRTAPGASSQGGITDQGVPVAGDPNRTFFDDSVGDFGFPGISSSYSNVLGALDLAKLTTVTTDCTNIAGTPVACADLNATACAGVLAPAGNKLCTNDGSGKNVYGTEVEIRHSSDGRFENTSTEHIVSGTNIALGDKVYYYPNAIIWLDRNHTITNNGAGVIVSRGLEYQYNGTFSTTGLTYASTAGLTNIEDLASLLWITTDDDVNLHPRIATLAGSYIVGMNVTQPSTKGVFDSCYNSSDCGQTKLMVFGVILAWEFQLGRTYYGPTTSQEIAEPAEVVVNDGRLLTNPPPGVEDFSKALPRFQQVRP